MKSTTEIRPFPNSALATQLAELHKLQDGTRMGLSAGMIGMQTTKGIVMEPDPMQRYRRIMSSGTSGPARWG